MQSTTPQAYSSAALEQAYRELRAIEDAVRERDIEIRERVWNSYCQPHQRGWWRCGFYRLNSTFRHAFGEGDRDTIPNFDCLADELAMTFPELGLDGDPAATLFEYLQKPHIRRSSKAELLERAADWLEHHTARQCVGVDDSWRNEPF